MPYEIKDRLSLKLFFAGVEFPFERANSLNFIHLSASSRIGIPMMHISLDDVVDFFADASLLGDGIPIEIVLAGPGGESSQTYNFRLNTYRKKSASPGTQYEIDGYLNVPAYWHQSALNPIKGTATEALKTIASRCGLTFSGENTNDSMTWFPSNKKYHAWAREICSRSFKAATSMMNLGLDFDSTLHFVDVTDLGATKHQAAMAEVKQGYIFVTDFQPDTSSGTNNARFNYSSARVYQNSMEDLEKLWVYDDKIDVQPYSGEISFLHNTVLKESVTRGNVAFSPISFGNTHAYYERAKYQNPRHNALFSQSCSIVTPDVTKIKLFDTVFLSFDATNTSSALQRKAFSGLFRAVSRTVYVHANNYYEKIDLVRRAFPVKLSEN
jgi:hypothetical protein